MSGPLHKSKTPVTGGGSALNLKLSSYKLKPEPSPYNLQPLA